MEVLEEGPTPVFLPHSVSHLQQFEAVLAPKSILATKFAVFEAGGQFPMGKAHSKEYRSNGESTSIKEFIASRF